MATSGFDHNVKVWLPSALPSRIDKTKLKRVNIKSILLISNYKRNFDGKMYIGFILSVHQNQSRKQSPTFGRHKYLEHAQKSAPKCELNFLYISIASFSPHLSS